MRNHRQQVIGLQTPMSYQDATLHVLTRTIRQDDKMPHSKRTNVVWHSCTLVTTLLLLLLGSPHGLAQDASTFIDMAPTVAAVLIQTLEKSPPFAAIMEVRFTDGATPTTSTGSGRLAYRAGGIRWDVTLGDINSPQLSPNAKAAIRSINGEKFLFLCDPRKHVGNVILPGAHAYLEQKLPELKGRISKGAPSAETLWGRPALKQKIILRATDGTTNTAVVWRLKGLKDLPAQLQFTNFGQTVRIQLKQPELKSPPNDEFKIPAGLTKYNSVEDLIQSVVLTRMKKRLGVE